MANNRFKLKQFAGNASNNGVFGSFSAGTNETSNDPDTIQSLSAWLTGWLDATTSASILPRLEEMQGVQFVLCKSIIENYKEGVPSWLSTEEYYQYSLCTYFDATHPFNIYINKTGNYTTTNPAQDTTNWTDFISFFGLATPQELEAKANDNEVVHLTGNETIDGVKTFENPILYDDGSEVISTAQLQTVVIRNPLTAKCSVVDGVFIEEAGSISIFPYGKGTPTLNVGDDFNGWGTIVSVFTKSSGEIFYYVKRNAKKSFASLGSATGTSVLFERNNGSYNKASISYVYSGSTEPKQNSGSCWYDTANNYVKFSNGTTYDGIYSLPLCQLSLSSGVPQLITKRFASIGYIGTIFFVAPGVEVLVPNGKTDDGQYKYTKTKVTNVLTRTFTTAEAALGKIIPVIRTNQSLGFGSNFEIVDTVNNRKTTQGYAWALDENKVYTNNKITVNNQVPLAVVRFSGNSISDFDSFNAYAAPSYEFMRTGIIPTIIDTYSDTSGNWYRLYSDGWCEQGGNSQTIPDVWTITFLVPFKDTNYNIQGEQHGQDNLANLGVMTKNAGSCAGNTHGVAGATVDWIAKGYAF